MPCNMAKPGDRLKATQLYIKLEELKKQHAQEMQDSLPLVQDVMRIQEMIELRQEMDVLGVKKIADLRCCVCGKELSADGEGESND